MNLLQQFGLEPIKKKTTGNRGLGRVYFTAILHPHKTYTLGLGPMVKTEKLEWPGIDIAFSKQHSGLFVAKGNTFMCRKNDPGRVDSIDIYNLIFQSFSLKRPKNKGKIIFDYQQFSTDVYLLKIDEIINN